MAEYKWHEGDRFRIVNSFRPEENGYILAATNGYTLSRDILSAPHPTTLQTIWYPHEVQFLPRGEETAPSDPVKHPSHYTSDPSGVECITITRHRNFNIGNAIKYLWRQGLKSSGKDDAKAKQIEDLHKAIWYIQNEIERLEENEID